MSLATDITSQQPQENGAVDLHFDPRRRPRVRIVCEGGESLSAVLNQVDVAENLNRFFILQLLQAAPNVQNRSAPAPAPAPTPVQQGMPGAVQESYILFSRSGRTGDIGHLSYDFFLERQKALEAFFARFRERAGVPWHERKKGGAKYELIQTKSDGLVAGGGISLLGPERELVAMLFDPELHRAAVSEFHLDGDRLPLGQLDQTQLSRASEVLARIAEILRTECQDKSKMLLQASNEFYSMVPHASGRTALPIICNEAILEEKQELLEVLGNLAVAGHMRQACSKIDDIMRFLKCDVSLVTDPEVIETIRSYLTTNRGSHDFQLEVKHIFAVCRQGEKLSEESGNCQLLWHGSRLANFAGILTQGLKINPLNVVRHGSMFGNGIYFANSATKSAQYLHAAKGQLGVLALCAVSLGNCWELKQSANVQTLPAGFSSVWGRGEMTPDPRRHQKLPGDPRITVPIGTLQPSYQGGSLMYDEYVVYRESQVQLRYLVLVKV
ncbi:MAG: hypothetical protein ACYCOU_05175 [Sulfobacillus sp.]